MPQLSLDPEVERERQRALERYHILDTPREATFDRIVAVVAAVFDVQFAMITLVDRGRSWYKAEVGMGVRELPREDNMCDATIRHDGVFVIDDAERAPPDLVAPLLKRGMRFYAGAPLRTQDGIKLGTICAVDTRPHTFGERERRVLADLAQVVIDELELRLAARRIVEAEGSLRRLNAELELVNKNKNDFITSLSHELRAPLNGILGATELIEGGYLGPLDDRQREYVAGIDASGRHLLRLIDDVLDLSRIEAGQVELRPQPLAVDALLRACATVVRGSASAKSQELAVESRGDALTVFADERRVVQIACNLLSNAIKFSPPGGQVTLSAAACDSEVVFCVADQGPGIPSHLCDRIFEQFFRASSEAEGTGLGLPVARRLAELQGGRIWLESEPGRGSRFFFALPRFRPPD